MSVSRHTSRVVNAILLPCMVLTVVALILLWPTRPDTPANPDGGGTRRAGLRQRADRDDAGLRVGQRPARHNQPCGVATVRITSGPGADGTIEVDLPRGPGAPTLRVGDQVVLAYLVNVPAGVPQYAVVDHQHGTPMVFMLALCALVIVAFGRWRGLAALVGLAGELRRPAVLRHPGHPRR